MVIYCITNLVNGKIYIGQTIYKNPNKRWTKHKYDTGVGSLCAIHMAMRKHGIDSFNFEVIDESASDLDELNDLESFYVSFYDTFKSRGYNMTSGGESTEVSDETRNKISKGNTGKIKTLETREKIRQANIGKKLSEETKKKISDAVSGEKNGFYGRKHSDETKEKLSEASRGNTFRLGKKHTDETKLKMSESQFKSKYHKIAVLKIQEGVIVSEYKSINEAERQTGIDSSSISAVCKGKRKTAGGFKWRYA